jgi:hypothetical protein
MTDGPDDPIEVQPTAAVLILIIVTVVLVALGLFGLVRML